MGRHEIESITWGQIRVESVKCLEGGEFNFGNRTFCQGKKNSKWRGLWVPQSVKV